jgi:hypothetical protein
MRVSCIAFMWRCGVLHGYKRAFAGVCWAQYLFTSLPDSNACSFDASWLYLNSLPHCLFVRSLILQLATSLLPPRDKPAISPPDSPSSVCQGPARLNTILRPPALTITSKVLQQTTPLGKPPARTQTVACICSTSSSSFLSLPYTRLRQRPAPATPLHTTLSAHQTPPGHYVYF